MQANINQLMLKYKKLKPRERALVLSALLAVVFTAWSALIYQPMQQSFSKVSNDVATMRKDIEALKAQQTVFMQSRNQDPNAETKLRIAKLDEELVKLNTQLQAKLRGLIAPREMAGMLEGILKQHSNLQLQRIQNISAQPIVENDSEDDTPEVHKNVVEIYRHGVEIEFTGSYLDTLAFFQALKSLPYEFYWDAVQYEVDKYPVARVILTVHTLSLKEGWIGV